MSIVSDAFKVLLKNWDEGNYPIGGIPQIDEDGLPDVEYMVEKGYQTRFYQYRFDKDKNYLWPIPASDLIGLMIIYTESRILIFVNFN